MRHMPNPEHALRSLARWAGFKFPDADVLPPRPWWSDGDAAFRPTSMVKAIDSDQIMAHVAASGRLVIGDGNARPELGGGRTSGVRVNAARPGDPEFTISKEAGPKKLWVSTGYRAPYGSKVRIPTDATPQGWPMNEYSDHKMHLFDASRRTITEVQYITEPKTNPVLGVLGWLASLLSGKDMSGGYHCHGVQQTPLDGSSFDSIGSSAARLSLVGHVVRVDDIRAGWRGMTAAAVPAAAKQSWVWPARGSDGPSTDAEAVQMGQVLRLTPTAAARLRAVTDDPFIHGYIECLERYGAVVLDTAHNVSIGQVEPDTRIDSDAMRRFTAAARITDFEVWEIPSPPTT